MERRTLSRTTNMGQSSSSGAPSAAQNCKQPKGKIAQERAAQAEQRRAERQAQKELEAQEKELRAAERKQRKTSMPAPATSLLQAPATASSKTASSSQQPVEAKRTTDEVEATRRAKATVAAPASSRSQPAVEMGTEKKNVTRRTNPATSNSTDSNALPPEVQALLADTTEDDSPSGIDGIDVAAAIAAATALCLAEGSEGDESVDDAYLDEKQPTRSTAPRKVAVKVNKKRQVQGGGDDDDIENVSLHSSDLCNEELLADLHSLEAEVNAERTARMEQLAEQIDTYKKSALALMKGGNKPMALEELKKAKELEKELNQLQRDCEEHTAQ